MSESQPGHTCSYCGTVLPHGVPESQCPRCVMAQIIQPTQDGGPQPVLPPLTPEELAPHFPQLEILECLGRGGMGVVYKARQKSLNRLVALKLLAPERADDPKFAARFEKEAQALAALNHPHIVGVYDFGKVTTAASSGSTLYYLLMEFMDGVNLRQLLQSKRLTPKEALSIVPPVCEALQCAHDHGIVHRDIKPENLLMDKAGVVKIADFGIAKIVGDAESIAHGTPDYAAPEQESGRADHRADIYSLGVVLYEMLTGERPKDKLEAPSRLAQVDIRIDELVMRALARAPELRFATAAEFRNQVQALEHTRTEPPWWMDLVLPAMTYVLLYAGFIWYVVSTTADMPAKMATHFNAEGAANGWMSTSEHKLFICLMPAGTLLFFALIMWPMVRFPKVFDLNVPHKAYWMAPENRPRGLRILARSKLWLCCIMVLFFGGIHWHILQANMTSPPRLPSGLMIPLLTAFFALMMLWIVHLIYSFTRVDLRHAAIHQAAPERSLGQKVSIAIGVATMLIVSFMLFMEYGVYRPKKVPAGADVVDFSLGHLADAFTENLLFGKSHYALSPFGQADTHGMVLASNMSSEGTLVYKKKSYDLSRLASVEIACCFKHGPVGAAPHALSLGLIGDQGGHLSGVEGPAFAGLRLRVQEGALRIQFQAKESRLGPPRSWEQPINLVLREGSWYRFRVIFIKVDDQTLRISGTVSEMDRHGNEGSKIGYFLPRDFPDADFPVQEILTDHDVWAALRAHGPGGATLLDDLHIIARPMSGSAWNGR